ncbi:MAG: hypothetical protein H7Y04_11285, partial [Verrucomicrobia bacterium]|nr:hypothetical protein [Cytophagales bacterium]
MKITFNPKIVFVLALSAGIFLADFSQAQAQGYRRETFGASKRYTSIGVMVSALNYFGDITPRESFTSTDIQFTRPSFGVFVSRRISPNVCLRGSLAYGTLKGDDFDSQSTSDANAKFRYVRNLSFRNRITELAFSVSYDLIGNRKVFYKRPRIVPYIFGGIAGFYHNPKAKLSSEEAGRYGLSEDWI